MSAETQTASAADADTEQFVRTETRHGDRLHQLVSMTEDDDPHAMPACDPSRKGEVVEADTVSEHRKCRSPRCFGGDR